MAQSSLGYNLPTLLPSRGSQLGEPFPCVGLPTVDPTFCREGGWMGEGMSQSRSQTHLQGAATPASGWYYIQSAFQCCVALSTSVGLS